MDYLESRIATLERLVYLMPRQVDQIRTKLGTVDQQIQGMRSGGYGCTTTISGTITGGLAPTGSVYVPMPDCTVQIIGHVTGIDYGTYAVPTGNYSIDIVGVDPLDTSLDFYPYGPATSPRFNMAPTLLLAYNRVITLCGLNSNLIMIPPASPGYGYLLYSFAGTFACQYPVGPLAWTDSRIGSGTASVLNFGSTGISAIGSWQSSCFVSNTFANLSCVARATVPMLFNMAVSGQAYILYTASSLGGCAINGTCPGVGMGNGNVTYSSASITSKTCPSFDLTTKFDCTWFANDQVLHNGVANTIRFYEP